MKLNNSRFKGQARQRGIVLIAVLVCIGVATTILFGAVEKSLRCRRQMRNETQLEQVRWLVDAGIRKAISNLEQRPDYEGERLVVTPQIYQHLVAKVEIKIEPANSSTSDQVRVVVTAALHRPDEELPKVKRTKELVFSPSGFAEDTQ